MKQKELFKEFLRYVILNVCGMIGLSCYILADTFFVSVGLGTNGLTALNLAIPVYSFVNGCGLMFGMGGATKYAIFRGRKENRNADNTFSSVLCLTMFLTVVFLLIGIFLSGNIAAILGADGDVFSMTKTYLQVILLFAPAFMLNDVLICFVRNDGNPKLSMTAMLIGSLSNIIMDYLFIFPLQMGILGAVLATGFAPVISMCILSRHWITGQNRFHIQKLKLFPDLIKDTVCLGVPSLITEVASGIVMIIFNIIILRLEGNTGVAAYGIIANLSLVVTAVYTGIAQGIQPITSRSYGCGDQNSIKKILAYAMTTMLLLSGCIYAIFLLNAGPIVSIFNREQNILLQQIATVGLKLYFTAIPFAGFNIVLSTHFTSTEKALRAQTVSLSRGLFIIIPMAFFMAHTFEMTGVWLSYPITELLVSILGFILLFFLP